MPLTFIINEKARIERRNEKNIFVGMNETEGTTTTPCAGINYRCFKLKCGYSEYYIHCPAERTEEGVTLTVPSFMVPGRPYPIYVYIYAVTMYCANSEMGQREAARKTGEYFGISTFSHTTVGRAMKAIEQVIQGQPLGMSGTAHPGNPDKANEITPEGKARQAKTKRFPMVGEMRERKRAVVSHLKEAEGNKGQVLPAHAPKQPCPPYKGAFIDACHQISAYTYKKHRRLLL